LYSFGEKTPVSYLTDLLAFNNAEDLREFIKKTGISYCKISINLLIRWSNE